MNSDRELDSIKHLMERDFEKNQVRKEDAQFEYDVRVSFFLVLRLQGGIWGAY